MSGQSTNRTFVQSLLFGALQVLVLSLALSDLVFWIVRPVVLNELAQVLGNGMAFNTAVCVSLLAASALLGGKVLPLRLALSLVALAICGAKMAYIVGLTDYNVDFLFHSDAHFRVSMGDQTAMSLGFIAVDQVIRTKGTNTSIADLFRFLALWTGVIGVLDNLLSFSSVEHFSGKPNQMSVQTALSIMLLSLSQWPKLATVRNFEDVSRVLRLKEYAITIAILFFGVLASEEKRLIAQDTTAKVLQSDAAIVAHMLEQNVALVSGAASHVLAQQNDFAQRQSAFGYARIFEAMDGGLALYDPVRQNGEILEAFIMETFALEVDPRLSVGLEISNTSHLDLRVMGGVEESGKPYLLYFAMERDAEDGPVLVVVSRPMGVVFDPRATLEQVFVGLSIDDIQVLGSTAIGQMNPSRTVVKDFVLGNRDWSLSLFATPVFTASFGPFSLGWIVPFIAFVVGFSANRTILARERLHELQALNKQNQEIMAKLEQQNRELSQFAYICSHDLKEPFRMVSTFSKRLRSQLYSTDLKDEVAKQYLDILSDAGDRAGLLIEDLLAYTVCDDENIPRDRIDPVPVIQECFESAKLINPEREARFSYGNFTILNVNRLQFKQISQNLIDNAVKYSKSEGPIEIEYFTRLVGRDIVFVVKDNGIGIPEKHRDKVFGVFKRLHARDQIAGTGIGLAICAKIVAAYHGKIWVDPDCSEGTEICFTLPAASQNK